MKEVWWNSRGWAEDDRDALINQHCASWGARYRAVVRQELHDLLESRASSDKRLARAFERIYGHSSLGQVPLPMYRAHVREILERACSGANLSNSTTAERVYLLHRSTGP